MKYIRYIVCAIIIIGYSIHSIAQNEVDSIQHTIYYLSDCYYVKTITENGNYQRQAYNITEDRLSVIPFVQTCSADIQGNFFSELFDHAKMSYEDSWNNAFGGIPFSIKVEKGDVLTMSFDFATNSMYNVEWRNETRRVEILDDRYSTIVNVANDAISEIRKSLYVSPDYNCVAVKKDFSGVFFPFIRDSYTNVDNEKVNADYTIHVRKYGKIVSLKFQIADGAKFDYNDKDGMLKYNLLNNVRISATDTYGNEVPILNSLVTQWEVDNNTKTAKFTPILYPFSIPFVTEEDAELDENSANKSLTIAEEEMPTLEDFCTMEVIDESMLTLDLELFSQGGIVTHIANVNTNSTAQDVWYDMFGRKYTTKPTAKGLYIHNGKKEVVK